MKSISSFAARGIPDRSPRGPIFVVESLVQRCTRLARPLSAALLFVAAAAAPFAADINVPADQPTINAAIAAAAPSGDTVVVAAGTYLENVNFLGKDVIVQGSGASSTIIDGGAVAACVDMSGTPSTAKLAGFMIRYGNGFEAGGIIMYGSSATVADCRIEDNDGFLAGGAYVLGGSPAFKNCTFTLNVTSVFGGGMWNDAGSVTLDHCDFLSNTSPLDGGGLFSSGTTTLISCDFEANQATGSNGGGIASTGPLALSGCFFAGNSALGNGGGVIVDSGTLAAVNCTFSGNSSADGGGFYLANSGGASLINCTFSQNIAGTGGALWVGNSSPVLISNSILWGDTGGEIHLVSGALTVQYSDVQGGFAGTGNFSLDPVFVDPDGAMNVPGTLDDDLRLQDTSPCIDFGNNADINATGVTTDQDGFARIVDGGVNGLNVDMGAYEFVPAPPPPPTPDQRIVMLKNDVTQLVTEGVHLPADGKALQITLSLARRWLANGRTDLAVAALSVFKLQVTAYRLAHRLTPTQAQPLIDSANVIISEISP